MSRYSPTVLPQARRSPMGMFGDAIEQYYGARQAFRGQKEHEEDRAYLDYERGVRRGPIPGEADRTLDVTPQSTEGFSPVSNDDWARAIHGNYTRDDRQRNTLGGTPGSSEFSVALQGRPEPARPQVNRTWLPPDSQDIAGSREDTPPAPTMPPAAPAGPTRIGGAAHPGGFDPNTHTFGGTPQRHAADQLMPPARQVQTFSGPTGRYMPLTKDRYLDTEATPEARASRAKMAEFEFEKRLAEELQRSDPKYQAEVRSLNARASEAPSRIAYNQARTDAAINPRPRPTTRTPAQEAQSRASTAASVAGAEHARTETTDLQSKALDREADRLVQSLAAQSPDWLAPDKAKLYLEALQRNGRASKTLTPEHIYSALDRYHNPPNRADTPATVAARVMQTELGRGGGRGGAGTGRGGAGAAAGRTVQNADPQKTGGKGDGKPSARQRYDQLLGEGKDKDSILRQMRREGYPPPPKK